MLAVPDLKGEQAVLFKRFADVDGIDLEIDTRDVDEFINCVRFLGPSFGGINLEDIKAPDCFLIARVVNGQWQRESPATGFTCSGSYLYDPSLP